MSRHRLLGMWCWLGLTLGFVVVEGSEPIAAAWSGTEVPAPGSGWCAAGGCPACQSDRLIVDWILAQVDATCGVAFTHNFNSACGGGFCGCRAHCVRPHDPLLGVRAGGGVAEGYPFCSTAEGRATSSRSTDISAAVAPGKETHRQSKEACERFARRTTRWWIQQQRS